MLPRHTCRWPSGRRVRASRHAGARDDTLPSVTAGDDAGRQQREEWERQRRRMRRLQDLGLVMLGIGVLVLAFIALTYRP